MTPAPRPIVVVVGMHRSGTSLCANILNALGIDIADRPALRDVPAADNLKGHWERWEIVALHNKILDYLHRRYFSPQHDLPLPPAWWSDPGVEKLRDEIVRFLRGRMVERLFGFKDPRTMRLLPMWDQIYGLLGLAPKYLFCLRNPAQVARSLQHRDRLDLAWGEYRWLTHIADFFFHIGDTAFCTIEYENWFAAPDRNLERLRAFLDIPETLMSKSVRNAVAGIIDRDLRHDDGQREARSSLVRSAYRLAKEAGSDTGARAALQSLSAEITALRELERPMFEAFAGIAPVALAGFADEKAGEH